MIKKVCMLLGLALGLAVTANAQAKKIHLDPFIWPELQADYYTNNQSFFFFRNQFRHNTDPVFAGLSENGAFSKLYQVYVQLGYDHKFTEHWRGEVSARYTFDANNDNQVYQAMLQHNGKIGSVDFLKSFAYDYMKFQETESFGRARPRIALERNLKIGSQIFRPHFSYELFLYNNFNADQVLEETRTVDRSRMRLAVGYKAASFLWLTPYFMKQTEFYNVLTTYTGEFDADGNPIVKEEGGKRNRIEPVFGLELRFLFPSKNITDTTIPGLGTLIDNPAN